MAGTAARLMNNVIKQHLHHVTHADASYDQTSPVNFIAAFRHAANNHQHLFFLICHVCGEMAAKELFSGADARRYDYRGITGAS